MFQSLKLTVQNSLLIFLMSAALWAALIAVARAEVIRSFDSDILINEDGSFLVTETIVSDFETEARHGIYRNIKDRHPQNASTWYKERYIRLQPISVLRDGLPEPFVEQPYDGLSLKIGREDELIFGSHTYQITYLVTGGLVKYSEGVELYWNVTGNEWLTTIERAAAKVRTVDSAALAEKQYCYFGEPGSNQECWKKENTDGLAIFVSGPVSPGSEFTIAQALSLSQTPLILERIKWTWFWAVGIVIWFSFLITWLYRWRFKYQARRSIIAQYEPLPNFKPMFTGVLFDNRLDSRDITAGILYLAQQGFISIKQTTEKVLWMFDATDYEVTLLRSPEEVETEFQRQILTLIFEPSTGVGVTRKLSDFQKDQSRQRKNAATIQALRKSVVKELIKQGLLEQTLGRGARIAVFLVLLYASFYLVPIMNIVIGLPMTIVIVISVLIVLIGGFERRTAKGFEALNHLKGFKEFLSVTEKERYTFHNAPALSPQQFLEYIPYAIAFGVEKEWAEVFENIQIEQPSWYSSTTGAHFDAGTFSTGIGVFGTAFASSTGSSGSSGGGHSGGGGGGGGGGSW